MDIEATLHELVDRQQITDTLLRYASTVDTKDYARMRTLFADDAVAKYAGAEPLEGGDAIVSWIQAMTADRAWQHHFLSVYHIDLDGDTASTLTYHTSHSTGDADPDTVLKIVARYTDELRRINGKWKITNKVMQVGWMEEGHASQSATADREAADSAAARASGNGGAA